MSSPSESSSDEKSESEPPSRVAMLVGATGLIGGHLLEQLLASTNYQRVIVVARKSCPSSLETLEQSERLRWWTFEQWDAIDHTSDGTEPIDHFFCALGTTKKQSGKRGLMAIDRDLVVKTATSAVKDGASLVSVVSATGANPNSMFFYNRVKGEMEHAVGELPVPQIHFWQPSVLLGARDQQRFAETLAGVLLRWPLPKNIQARHGAQVASAMIRAASQNKPGTYRFNVREIDMFNSGETL